jgi:hypothetical protein
LMIEDGKLNPNFAKKKGKWLGWKGAGKGKQSMKRCNEDKVKAWLTETAFSKNAAWFDTWYELVVPAGKEGTEEGKTGIGGLADDGEGHDDDEDDGEEEEEEEPPSRGRGKRPAAVGPKKDKRLKNDEAKDKDKHGNSDVGALNGRILGKLDELKNMNEALKKEIKKIETAVEKKRRGQWSVVEWAARQSLPVGGP